VLGPILDLAALDADASDLLAWLGLEQLRHECPRSPCTRTGTACGRTHPLGRSMGDGISPLMGSGARSRVGSAMGTALSRARV